MRCILLLLLAAAAGVLARACQVDVIWLIECSKQTNAFARFSEANHFLLPASSSNRIRHGFIGFACGDDSQPVFNLTALDLAEFSHRLETIRSKNLSLAIDHPAAIKQAQRMLLESSSLFGREQVVILVGSLPPQDEHNNSLVLDSIRAISELKRSTGARFSTIQAPSKAWAETDLEAYAKACSEGLFFSNADLDDGMLLAMEGARFFLCADISPSPPQQQQVVALNEQDRNAWITFRSSFPDQTFCPASAADACQACGTETTPHHNISCQVFPLDGAIRFELRIVSIHLRNALLIGNLSALHFTSLRVLDLSNEACASNMNSITALSAQAELACASLSHCFLDQASACDSTSHPVTVGSFFALILSCGVFTIAWRRRPSKAEPSVVDEEELWRQSKEDEGEEDVEPGQFLSSHQQQRYHHHQEQEVLVYDVDEEYVYENAEDWEEAKDPESGNMYWVNMRTGAFQWTRPNFATTAPAPRVQFEVKPSERRASTNSNSSGDESEVWVKRTHVITGMDFFINERFGVTPKPMREEKEEESELKRMKKFPRDLHAAAPAPVSPAIPSRAHVYTDMDNFMNTTNPLYTGGGDIDAMEDEMVEAMEAAAAAAASASNKNGILRRAFSRTSRRSISSKSREASNSSSAFSLVANRDEDTPGSSSPALARNGLSNGSSNSSRRAKKNVEEGSRAERVVGFSDERVTAGEERDFHVVRLPQSSKKRVSFTKKKDRVDMPSSNSNTGREEALVEAGRVKAMRAKFERRG